MEDNMSYIIYRARWEALDASDRGGASGYPHLREGDCGQCIHMGAIIRNWRI